MTIKSIAVAISMLGMLAAAPAALAQQHGGPGGYGHGDAHGGYDHGGYDRGGDDRGDDGRGGYGRVYEGDRGGPRGYFDGGHLWHWYAGFAPAYGGYGYPPEYYAPPPVYYAPPPAYYAPPAYYYAPPVITIIP
jgi:hypothetical protein